MRFGIQDNGLVFLPREDGGGLPGEIEGRRHREYKFRIGFAEDGTAYIYLPDRHQWKVLERPRGHMPEVEVPLKDMLWAIFNYLSLDSAGVLALVGLDEG